RDDVVIDDGGDARLLRLARAGERENEAETEQPFHRQSGFMIGGGEFIDRKRPRPKRHLGAAPRRRILGQKPWGSAAQGVCDTSPRLRKTKLTTKDTPGFRSPIEIALRWIDPVTARQSSR